MAKRLLPNVWILPKLCRQDIHGDCLNHSLVCFVGIGVNKSEVSTYLLAVIKSLGDGFDLNNIVLLCSTEGLAAAKSLDDLQSEIRPFATNIASVIRVGRSKESHCCEARCTSCAKGQKGNDEEYDSFLHKGRGQNVNVQIYNFLLNASRPGGGRISFGGSKCQSPPESRTHACKIVELRKPYNLKY